MRARLTSPAVWMTGSMAAVFVVGLVVATATPGPLLTADDLAYFGLAYTLAGEGAAPMPSQPPYGLLYPLLLAPGWVIGLDEAAMLTWARVLNAWFGAVMVPVLSAFVRRVTDVGSRSALPAATAAAMMPALLLTGSIAWTERLLALLVAIAALLLARLWEHHRPVDAVLAVVAAAAMFAGHPRLGPPALIVIVAAAVAVRPRGRAQVAAVVASGAVVLWLVERARAMVAEAAFASDGTYDAADLASRRGFDLVPQMAQHGLGATAYIVLAGTGIAVWGIVHLARNRTVGWSVLAVAVAVLAIASWFITGVPRADKWLHGRYIEVMAPVFVAVGLAVLPRLRTRAGLAVLVGVPVVAGIVAAWNGPGNTWLQARSPVMMLGVEVSGAPYGSRVFEPGAAASVAVIVGLAAWWLARWKGVELAAGLLIVVSTWGAHSGDRTLDNLFVGTAAGDVRATLPADAEIAEVWVDTSALSPNLTNAVAWEVGFDRTTLDFGADTTHVLVPVDAEPPGGSVRVAEFSQGTLWRLGG